MVSVVLFKFACSGGMYFMMPCPKLNLITWDVFFPSFIKITVLCLSSTKHKCSISKDITLKKLFPGISIEDSKICFLKTYNLFISLFISRRMFILMPLPVNPPPGEKSRTPFLSFIGTFIYAPRSFILSSSEISLSLPKTPRHKHQVSEASSHNKFLIALFLPKGDSFLFLNAYKLR